MSQHDMNIANQGFPAFRADLNSALGALATNSAGTTEPSTTFAQQLWYDSTNNLLKMRNTDNDAWITLAYFDQTNDEWEVRSAVIQAVDAAGVQIKTDEGTTRIDIQDDGDISFNSGDVFIDSSGNVGIGATPKTDYNSNYQSSIQFPYGGLSGNTAGVETALSANAYRSTDGSWKRLRSGYATNLGLNNGSGGDPLTLRYSGSGAADSTITWSEAMRIDSSGNVNITTASDNDGLNLATSANGTTAGPRMLFLRGTTASIGSIEGNRYSSGGELIFGTSASTGGTPIEAMRVDFDQNLLIGKDNRVLSNAGIVNYAYGRLTTTTESSTCILVNRQNNDGYLVEFYQGGSAEGRISVSGTTVSYVGGHLARNSRLLDDSKDTSIVKGTVMTNLDEMVVWSHDAVEAQDAVYETVVIPAEYDEDGNEITPETTEERLVSEAVEAKEAYTEDNEQLNKMAVSSVEGDPNVAGVFVNWDEEDDFNDMNVAMTGDMVIRIAQGTTVERGDLLMSAGDGTAKPQGDDIVRSKTIAKVTSTHVSHTYDDGSYLVPCVLMAC